MFRNYLVTALRNFTRHKLYSFINIAGLAVALACVVFIALFLRDELSYDRWIPGAENLYRVEGTLHFPSAPTLNSTASPYPLGSAVKAALPEVMAETHITPQNSTVGVGSRQFAERVDVVDPGFFRMVLLPLVEGRATNVFRQPESVVLSQSVAHKYFGDVDPIGRTIVMDATHPLIVTGVMRDLPHDTQLRGGIFIPNASKASQLPQSAKTEWFSWSGWTYIQLAPGADPSAVQAKAEAIFARRIPHGMIADRHMRPEQIIQIRLVPFLAVHLTTDMYGGMTAGGSWTTVFGFAAIAGLILLIACFNYMNLATARAMMRAREVSLRKTMGAMRRQLIVQFMCESVFTALIALVLAMAVVEVLLPAYDTFLGRPITFGYVRDWPLTLGIASVAVLAGLLGGLYPALVLSGFRPAAVLKTNASNRGGSGLLRTFLVVMQFSISIGLGVAALIIFHQINYARTLDLGFNRDNVVVLNGAENLNASTRDSLAHTLAASPDVAGVAQSATIPFTGNESTSNASIPGDPQSFTVRTIDISPNFPAVYGMRLLAGRFLSRKYGADIVVSSKHPSGINNGTNVLIDAAAVRMFGFTPEKAIGKTVKVGDQSARIVGVVRTALFGAGRKRQAATLYYCNLANFADGDVVSVRVKGGHIPDALTFIDRTWHQFAPTVAIRRHFLDDMFDELFAADEQEGAMFAIFVGIAIFIACLGLFGLASFTAERRTKEIGIRKVFGARVPDIVRLLLWQFSVPVLLANLIAWPVAWYWLHDWLEGYAYRIALSPVYFLAAGVAALLIAWLTVFVHALRVARANPVHALRYE